MSSPSGPTGIVSTGAERGIAVGRDAIGSLLVTGDNNTFFVGQYARLQDAYLSPALLDLELQLDRFAGRGWLVRAIDEALSRMDRGYVVLEADAGMGKSTFLAWLAQRRGYAHHFVRLMPDPADIAVALRNLSAQLIRAWDLDTLAGGGVLPPAADRPDFFHEVLAAAAERRDALRPGEPIVIVVDGLNETVAPAGQNPLGLPRALPPGVYLLVSQRPVHVPLRLSVPRVVVSIGPDSQENRRDAQEFLLARAQSPQIRAVLVRDGLPADQFVDTLLAKSRGVWVYLHYVIAEIEAGRLSPSRLDRLPVGLWNYYAQYWHDWQRQHADRWHDFDLPLLAVIAVSTEPLPAGLIAELAATGRAPETEELLDNDWRPFLRVDDSGDEVVYSAFHDSLREFVGGAVDTSELSAAERALARRLATATKAAHEKIADRYLVRWGGLPAGLPEVPRSRPGTLDASYGFRRVVDHLVGAGRLDEVDTLLTLSRPDGDGRVNVWYQAHRSAGMIAAYRRDLAVAAALPRTGAAMGHALRLRYTLMICSLSSLAEGTPPALWSLLARDGHVAAVEAVAQASEIPTAEDRAEALTNLVDVVPGSLRADVESQAMSSVRAVPDEFWRVGELTRLYPRIASERRTELLSVARSLTDPFFRMMAARVLDVAPGAPEALRVGHGNEANPESPSGLAASALLVEDYRRRREHAAARLTLAGIPTTRPSDTIDEEPAAGYWRAQLLTQAALAAPADERTTIVDAARQTAGGIGDRREANAAWAALAQALARRAVPQPGADAGRSLEALTRQVPDPVNQLCFLLSWAGEAAAWAGDGPFQAAAALVAQGADDAARVTALTESARFLARLSTAHIQDITRAVADPRGRADVLLTVAAQAARDTAEPLAAAVLALLRTHTALPGWAGLLSRAARLLATPALTEAADLARSVSDRQERESALSELGIRLCALGDVDAARALLDATSGYWRARLQAALATALPPTSTADAVIEHARAIPYALWRAEILARAAATTAEPTATQALLSEIRNLAADLDPASGVHVLARAAAAAPGLAGELTELCAQIARGIADPYERATAWRATVDALLASGKTSDALAACAEITVEAVRVDALTAILDAGPCRAEPPLLDQLAGISDLPARGRLRAAALASATRASDDPGRLSALLHMALDDLAAGHRAPLIATLPILLDPISLLDGPDAGWTVAHDLANVQRWWP